MKEEEREKRERESGITREKRGETTGYGRENNKG